MAMPPSSSYNSAAMDLLDSGPLPGDVKSPTAANDVESVTIRRADNGFIVECQKAPSDSPDTPSKSPKPQVAKSLDDAVSIASSLFGGGAPSSPEEEEMPADENMDASADNEREGVDAEP